VVRSGKSMRTYTVGEIVQVPWGLDVLPGTVVATYEMATGERVVVEVRVPGNEGEGELERITLPAHALELTEEEVASRRPGAWVVSLRYEEQVAQAVRRVLPDTAVLRDQTNAQRDLSVDLSIIFEDRLVLVEIKRVSQDRQITARQLRQVVALLERSPSDVPLILVTNSLLATSARREVARRSERLFVVRWRSPSDDDELGSVINRALLGGGGLRSSSRLHHATGNSENPVARETARAALNERHVVPSPRGGWDVKKSGGQSATFHTSTQAQAIQRAREMVRRNGGGEVVVHGRDGQIRNTSTVKSSADPALTAEQS
jgi:hypothetical protein